MAMNPEFLAKFPDAAALPILVTLLVLMRRRYPSLATRNWLLALTFIFISQQDRFLSLLSMQRWEHLTVHTLLVIGQVLAALTLACYRHPSQKPEKIDLPFLIFNTIPLLAFSTLYGYYIFVVWPYMVTAGVGIVILLSTSLWRKKSLPLALLGSICFAIAAALAYGLHYRTAEYWLLFCVFAVAVIKLRNSLPSGSIGKDVILTSLSVWAVSFLIHPWAITRPEWTPLANELWDLQKFFLCIGMLLVLLEDQVANTQWLALHDQLTDLPNRRLLDDWLDDAIATTQQTGSKLVVLLLDLDGFKAINDSCGHAIGDYVLREVAQRMQSRLEQKEMLARLGGDEFVIISPHPVNHEDIHRLETRFQEAIRQPLQIQGQQLSIGGTFGASTYPDDTLNCDPKRIAATLLHISDQRMYQRKTAR